MQGALRSALAQKTRLAALGTAVSKINHDLRNILASAMVVSDRLEQSQDPEVRHVTPRLLEAMDRAARLCSATLNFARAEASDPTEDPLSARAAARRGGRGGARSGSGAGPLAQRGRRRRPGAAPTAISCIGC